MKKMNYIAETAEENIADADDALADMWDCKEYAE